MFPETEISGDFGHVCKCMQTECVVGFYVFSQGCERQDRGCAFTCLCVCERERIICDVHTTACYTVSVKDACHNVETSGPRLLGGGVDLQRQRVLVSGSE